MKISELITALDEIKSKHGDVEVVRDDHDYHALEIDDCEFIGSFDVMLSDKKNFCYLS